MSIDGMFFDETRCPICGFRQVKSIVDSDYHYPYFDCAVCGRYMYGGLNINRNLFASYLFYNGKRDETKEQFFFIGYEKLFYKYVAETYPSAVLLTNQAVREWYPKKIMKDDFYNILDNILIYLSRLNRDSDENGYIELVSEKTNGLFFVSGYDFNMTHGVRKMESELQRVIKEDREGQIKCFAEIKNYIEIIFMENSDKIKILPEGHKRIEELKKSK